MIVESISVEDFQCYSGKFDKNLFEFKPGLNVIIGDNGSGKSKLYDAFYWLLYDKVFNSQTRSFESTSHVGINLCSDRAKANTSVGDKIFTKVQLVVSEKKQNSTRPIKYLLSRQIGFERISNSNDYNDPNNWKVDARSLASIEKNDILNFEPMREVGAFERISRKLLPTEMEPYLWFQGEQVDSLIDFKNEDSLTNAIDVLSDIKMYDFYIKIARKVAKQANEAYKREERTKTKLDTSTEYFIKDKERYEKLIEKEEENLRQVIENLEFAEQHKEELLGKIEDAKELERLKGDLTNSDNSIKRVEEELKDARKNFNNNLFTKKWLLRNASPYAEKFEKLQQKYDEKREDLKLEYKLELQQEEAKKHRLPENVPNKTYLEAMVIDNTCFLCNRKFEDGDGGLTYIEDLLEKTKSNRVKYTDFLKQNLKKNIQALYSNAYQLSTYSIPRIDESIQKELEKLDLLEFKSQSKRDDRKAIEEKLNHLLSTGSIGKDEAQNIVRNFRQYDNSKDRFTNTKFQIEARLKGYKEQLGKINEELKKTVGNEIDPIITEKKEVLDGFLHLALSTRNMVYEEQIKRIEVKANEHFHKMTRENKSVQGEIILEKRGKSYMPKNVDDKGVELTSINDSNIILIKLATIMAIVSAKGGTDLHPLISDAPTSKFSDNYTIGFCKTLSEVFNQSIIISYDFFHNKKLRERLLTEVDRLGSVYVIEPSQPESKRMNRIDLSTNISSLN
ncbi:AAA family ATPase [Draconibacterium sp. IB214405]|uniref:AAA family ATPase n=1 Tax=Draconibacterium sp. IB214405 TaxID=3097352 RepID=UPI002A124057|nr:AAA family ATPase [Draconibacterium sp. IB214405]MDX8338774.1 AAA family ATPase [Draconibacterium sp. IB214405]